MKPTPRDSPPFSSSRSAIILAAAIIVLAALAAYENSFSGPLVFDDSPSIAENPTIRQLWPIWTPLSPPQAVGVGGRPLLNLTYALNYALGGTSVWSYHALNLAIHILAGLTLFGIVRRTLRPGLLAFAVALLWTLHPLQTASVTYLSERAESLMGLFYLLTLYCFIRGVSTDGEGPIVARAEPDRRSSLRGSEGGTGENAARRASFFWFGLSWLACLFGMATKEVMVTAPVMVLLYDRAFVAGTFREAWRRHGRLYVALAGTWLLLGYLLFTSNLRIRGVGFGYGVSSWDYVLTESGVIVRYLGLALWPHPLVLDYDTPIVTRLLAALPDLALLLPLLAGAVFLFLGFPLTGRAGTGGREHPNSGEVGFLRRRLGERGAALGFVGCWFFLVLAPTSSVVPVAAQAMAENRMYLPLAALVVLAVLGIRALAGRWSAMVYLSLAIACGWLTLRRNEQYRSELSIWSDTVRRRPDNPRAHYLLANSLLRDGRAPEAIAHYEEAVRLHSDFAEAWNGWGFALAGAGRLPEAIDRYERALRLKPDYPEAAYNLANALAQAGRLPEAIARYEAALRLRPGFWEAEENLGSALFNTGRAAEAAAHFAAVLRARPGEADVHYDLALALRALGRLDEARAQFDAAARLGVRR